MEFDDLFNKHELVYAYAYVHGLKKGFYSGEKSDLISGKAERKYGEYVNKVVNSKPYTYNKNSFKSCDENQIIKKAYEIIVSIFGKSEKIDEEFNYFCSLMQYNNNDEVLSGCCEMSLSAEDGKVLYPVAVDIPKLDNTSSVVSFLHEFMHFHVGINNLDYNKKYYYQEILPIFGEKIASSYMECDDKGLTNKIENIRLDSISYHYSEEKEDYKNLAKFMKLNKTGFFDSIISMSDFENLGKYIDVLADSYGFGYLYAESLYQLYIRYLEARNRINDFLSNKCSLEDLLSSLKINAKNNQSYDYVDERIRSLK